MEVKMKTMTKEQKELLIKDLCFRLPYGVKASTKIGGNIKISFIGEDTIIDEDGGSYDISFITPYLFPLSSMTEEQKRDLTNLFNCTVVITEWEIIFPNYYDSNMDNWNKIFNWCYKNHFDINGLIPMGLAIDCTNLNIY